MTGRYTRSATTSRRFVLPATSLIAIAAALTAGPTFAQGADDAEQAAGTSDVLEEITVTGIRGSFGRSLDAKRGASQIVDAISAEEVGKFPDTNIAEALQRITGVAIDRSGGEGQFITVRGLGPEFNAVLLNGRTIATDNDGREFSFDVLAADIIQSAQVFKTAAPNLQSGGIGSVVNITTGRPLDRPGTHFTFSASGQFDTLREDFSPEYTGVASWTDKSERFGVFVGASYSNRRSQEDSSFTGGFALRDGSTNPGDIIVAAPESSTGLDASALEPMPASRVQERLVFSRDVQNRERITINGAVQFRPVENLTFTVDGLYTRFDIDSFATQFSGFFSPPFIDPVIDENGTTVSFSRPSVDFLNRNPAIADTVGLSQNDNFITSNNRLAKTYLVGGNVEWQANDRWSFYADISASNAKRDGTNPFVVLGALAETSPLAQLPDPDSGGIPTLTNLTALTDPTIQRLHFTEVTRTKVDDEVFELRAGGAWDVDRGPLSTISFGAFRTDRDKQRDLFDNTVAPTLGDGSVTAAQIFCAFCGYTVPFDTSILEEFSLGGFLNGVPGSEAVPPTIFTSTFEQAFAQYNNLANISDPRRLGGNTEGLLSILNDPDVDPLFGIYTPTFNPGGSFMVDEKVTAVYFNSQWEGDLDGTLPWSADIGFRFAVTETTSRGVDRPVTEFRETPGDTQLEVVFGPATEVSIKNRYVNFLPSINFKAQPTDDTVLRFGFSKTVTRPTMTSLGVANTFGGRSNAPVSSGGNPSLTAFESNNFDVSFEWYFGDISYVSIAGFHKNLGNFIEVQTTPVVNPVTFPAGNAGRTEDEVIDVTFQDTRARNGQTGSISGLEVAVQKTLDFLPWDGFGIGANYTFVTSDIDREQGAAVSDCDFNGLSPNTFNVSGFYERGRLQARLAYNYRDEFLVQCLAEFSEPRQRESFGQVDFSVAFDVNDYVQVFAEGINITSADARDFSRFRNRFLEFSDTGSRFTLGARTRF